jgi:hypothetical protein
VSTLAAAVCNIIEQKQKFSRSKVENLFKHRAGNYYAVVKVLGKIRRHSLDTDDYGLAKNRLGAVLAALRGATEAKQPGRFVPPFSPRPIVKTRP